MDNPTNIVFTAVDGSTITIDTCGVILSSTDSAVEITPQMLILTESVIRQHSSPSSDLDSNILDNGIQITPHIGLFGGPNLLGWTPGITLISPPGSNIALRCYGANIEVNSAKILLDGVAVATEHHVAVLNKRLQELETRLHAIQNPV